MLSSNDLGGCKQQLSERRLSQTIAPAWTNSDCSAVLSFTKKTLIPGEYPWKQLQRLPEPVVKLDLAC